MISKEELKIFTLREQKTQQIVALICFVPVMMTITQAVILKWVEKDDRQMQDLRSNACRYGKGKENKEVAFTIYLII